MVGACRDLGLFGSSERFSWMKFMYRYLAAWNASY